MSHNLDLRIFLYIYMVCVHACIMVDVTHNKRLVIPLHARTHTHTDEEWAEGLGDDLDFSSDDMGLPTHPQLTSCVFLVLSHCGDDRPDMALRSLKPLLSPSHPHQGIVAVALVPFSATSTPAL